ncbi:MAG: hypothetical protein J6X91_03355 [Bacteroidales bacterium]|nr:hypothetical protein [Bacteroidales bacterium]
MSKNDLKRERQILKAKKIAGILAGSVLLFGILLIALIFWLGYSTSWMKFVGYALFAVTFLSLILVLSLSSYDNKGGLFGWVYKVSFWILQVTMLFFELMFPSLLIIMGFCFVVLFPFSLIYGLLRLLSESIGICHQTNLFVSLSFGGILSAHYSKPFFGCLSRLLMSKGHAYEKYFKELVEYVYQPANIEFGICFLYVLFLIVSTICRFQEVKMSFLSDNNDIAILTSFLVFIAFSNMKAKHNASKFSFSEVFRIMYGMWSNHN